MPKKIQKIIAFVLLSFCLNAGLLSYAEEQEGNEGAQTELSQAINDIEDKPCVSPEEQNKAVFITYIEEPLTVQNDPVGTEADIVYRRCFRNTFIYRASNAGQEGKDIPLSRTSTACSENAQALVEQYADDESIKPRFTCQEIQVLINYKGGTSVLYSYIKLVYQWGASVVGVVAVTVIILSAIQIAASGGDPEAINKAKTRIIQSISGIVVLFLSAIILNTINPNFFTA